jgi:formyltetrahydrofolate synthetase
MNAPIGHNNPPAFDSLSLALEDAYATAKDFLDGKPIETQGEADSVGKIVSEVKRLKRDADAARAEEKAPHLQATRNVDAKWKPLTDRLDTIIKATQAPLTAYLNKLAEQQQEAERIAREEAARKAQEALEASRQAEGGVEAIERAKTLQKEADEAAKQATRAGKAKAHVAGMDRAIGLRSYQIARVTDRKALLQHIMVNDPEPLTEWLRDYARRALPMQLPGVTIETERRVA